MGHNSARWKEVLYQKTLRKLPLEVEAFCLEL